MRRNLALLTGLLLALAFAGCTTSRSGRSAFVTGESLVCIGDEPASLSYPPIPGGPLSVRSTYLPGPGTVQYIENRDFAIDYSRGTLTRTPGSRIPDFRTNSLFGQVDFDHSRFPGFGNQGFFAYVDYSHAPASPWPNQPSQGQLLQASRTKLRNGNHLRIVAFGDSITAASDISPTNLIYWNLWVDALRLKYPRATISVGNGATGGDSTLQGLQRLQSKVLDHHPDLVLIAFGMNDHNLNSVPVPQFETNLITLVQRIRQQTSAEVILLSTFPPNPLWKFGSHHMEDYAAATQRAAAATSCAYADVYSNWQTLAARKKPEDLLINNINHPNEFGHWLYYRVLLSLNL